MSFINDFGSYPDVIGYLLLNEDGQIINSGGELDKPEDIIRVTLNILKICDTSSFLTDLNSNWINIIFKNYYFTIKNTNKQVVILKKSLSKHINEQVTV